MDEKNMTSILEENAGGVNHYKACFKALKNKPFSSLGTTFRTENNYYFFDTGTGKVFNIDTNMYKVLTFLLANGNVEDIFNLQIPAKEIISTLEDLNENVEKQHILSAPQMGLENIHLPENLENIYENSINALLLEVTEKCNLRCKYCIYHENYEGYRDYGKKDMDWQTAKSAIDFFIEHSKETDDLHIGFYGGEPLLRFDLIKDCIEYVLKKVDDSKVSFSLTTNCTLITEEISDYLTNLKKIYITASLDGPQDINDAYRIYPNSEGSYTDIMKGIEFLIRDCKAKGKNIEGILSINTVIDYPETQDKFNKNQEFFSKNEIISHGVQKRYSYATHGPEAVEYTLPNSNREYEIINNLYNNHDSVTKWTIDMLKKNEDFEGLENSNLFSYADLNEMFTMVHHRAISNEVIDVYRRNSCCTPGVRRVYVEVDGSFKPCERVGFAPSIGNIKDGFNISNIKKNYLEGFSEKIIKYCNNCWAANVCGMCYIDAYDENGINLSYRHRHCESYRFNFKLALSVYHEILENRPKALEFLNDIVFN